MSNYLELSFSLSEAGGEHRWTEREGGNTAGGGDRIWEL